MDYCVRRFLILVICIFVFHSEDMPSVGFNATVDDKENFQVITCLPDNDDAEMTINMTQVLQFVEKTNEMDLNITYHLSLASFNYDTNLTTYNRKIRDDLFERSYEFYDKAIQQAKTFDLKNLKRKNETLYRWFKLFISESISEENLKRRKKNFMRSTDNKKIKSMDEIFNEARVCPYKSTSRKECKLSLYPDIVNIMSNSKNAAELKYIWKKFRDVTGKKMRNAYIRHISDFNKAAKSNGFKDYAEMLILGYESDTFVEDMAALMKKVLPLYRQLHAYVRRKLMDFYPAVAIAKDGPIPAHLLGDLYAQDWINIFCIVNPFPKKKLPNVTSALLEKGLQPLDLLIIAENFFTSIGLEKMTPQFWAHSVIEKPTDREMVCNAAAFGLSNKKDFRIRMCALTDEKSLSIVHHEMGHIEYFMLYRYLYKVFQESANPGFHEAVGDVIYLSSANIDYLKKINILETDYEDDEEMELIQLMKAALASLPTLPYAYIIDHYRYDVYNGTISTSELNKHWWEHRLKYQGVCPSDQRTESDFDPGAKYHIAFSVEYMRYFFANVLTFQMHKVLCKEAGHEGPLHKCSIYESKKAGDLLREVLTLGRSRPWQEVMLILTKGKTSKLSADPLLEYFEPLEKWLKKENKDETIGWKSSYPMKCPPRQKAKNS